MDDFVLTITIDAVAPLLGVMMGMPLPAGRG
ncbi:MAG: hypothetical protein QOJ59_3971 [Thermomicrobiales bacterium]|jgi:hypothetical protein|nr:hypothetical protein [Thermomicrobiales bacterium]